MLTENDYITYLALHVKYGDKGYNIIDHMIEKGEDVPVRNMCAKVHPVLIERLDNICELLDVSKRRFIEAAVAHAIADAEEALARACPGESK